MLRSADLYSGGTKVSIRELARLIVGEPEDASREEAQRVSKERGWMSRRLKKLFTTRFSEVTLKQERGREIFARVPNRLLGKLEAGGTL